MQNDYRLTSSRSRLLMGLGELVLCSVIAKDRWAYISRAESVQSALGDTLGRWPQLSYARRK